MTPTQEVSCEYCKIFKNSFFTEHLRWLLLVTAINRRFLKQLLHSSKDNMLHNSTSADMKVYALQPKQKSTADVSNRILQNFRTTTFQNKFVGLLLKRKLRGRRARIDPCGFRFSLFPGQLLSHKTIFFLHKFSHSRPFQFGLCYPFL